MCNGRGVGCVFETDFEEIGGRTDASSGWPRALVARCDPSKYAARCACTASGFVLRLTFLHGGQRHKNPAILLSHPYDRDETADQPVGCLNLNNLVHMP